MKKEALKLIIKERALVRLLKTIDNEAFDTRELLNELGEYGYGHKLLLKADKLGLVERRKVKPNGKGNWRISNKLSNKGKQVIKLAKEIGV
jgi:hypothetical protein